MDKEELIALIFGMLTLFSAAIHMVFFMKRTPKPDQEIN